MGFFWIIFITLMLPVEVRILPTYEVVADLGMLNSYAGLSVPLIASATATFLFRQVFLTIPDELAWRPRASTVPAPALLLGHPAAAVAAPTSRRSSSSSSSIGWNQYLWPLLVTTDESPLHGGHGHPAHGGGVADSEPEWHLVMMATAMLAMLPPVLVVVVMQRLFVKGLVGNREVRDSHGHGVISCAASRSPTATRR